MIIKHIFKNHLKHKSKLLKLINNMPDISLQKEDESVIKSDWSLDSKFYREYWQYFFPFLEPMIKDMGKKFYGELRIHNYWFQQYCNNNYYDWHNHPQCHFSSIYYLELPKGTPITEFKVSQEIKAKEGDIITFPGYLLHRSPPNRLKKRKTVIVFNSSIYHQG